MIDRSKLPPRLQLFLEVGGSRKDYVPLVQKRFGVSQDEANTLFNMSVVEMVDYEMREATGKRLSDMFAHTVNTPQMIEARRAIGHLMALGGAMVGFCFGLGSGELPHEYVNMYNGGVMAAIIAAAVYIIKSVGKKENA